VQPFHIGVSIFAGARQAMVAIPRAGLHRASGELGRVRTITAAGIVVAKFGGP
jgi:hypothetical protein